MSTVENKATLRRIAEAFNRRDLTFVDEVFSSDFVLHDPSVPEWPRGLEGARKMFTSATAAAPDLQVTIEDIFAEEDKVSVRWTFRGTLEGTISAGIPPTGGKFTSAAISVYRFENNKIVEDWGVSTRTQTNEPWA